jgi:hypothetical protein
MIERRLSAVQRPLLAESSHSELLDFNDLNVRYWEKQTLRY